MPLVRTQDRPEVSLRLNRDLVRLLKRGNPWVYADALRELPAASAGTSAILLDNKKGREIARGFYDPQSPIAFRACTVREKERLDDRWAEARFLRSLALRQMLFDEHTTGYRLFNGEGDALPGLVADIYGDTAVLRFDGEGPRGFWSAPGIAEWLTERLSLASVVERQRQPGSASRLVGEGGEQAGFLENGMKLTADVFAGQKTGFFLDQRDNRLHVRRLAGGRSTLNLFGYTGGFSVAAGLGGASEVTTVDLAAPALQAAEEHWAMNGLPPERHNNVVGDAFEFLEAAAVSRRRWELVIADPPSFAPSEAAVPKARSAYQRLIALSAAVTAADGLFAAASCSSHISQEMFLELCEEGVSAARRRATLLAVHGQPADHPTPLALPEFRYLKFVLMRID